MWFRPLGMLFGLTGLLFWSANAGAESRIALVIGNSAYKTVTALPNPANDARAMNELLVAAGFEVVTRPDLSQSDMRSALRDFAAEVALKGPDTVALVYFAGHGLQIEGENYLVPVDAKIERESDVAIEAVRLADVMSVLASTPSRTRIVILDACRNNPFSAINRTTGRGLAIVDAPTGSIVSYATAPGMEALDGAGDNSPFTAALVDVAKEPNLPIEQALKRIRLNVHNITEGRQTPWESSSLTSDFSFFGSPSAKVASTAGARAETIGAAASAAKPAGFWRKQLQGRAPKEAFDLVILEDEVDAYEEFLSLYATTAFSPRVRGLLERRREMMTWYTAVTVGTPLAFQAFLERYPNSDLAPTARRMRDRAQLRAQSANLTRGIPALSSAPAPTPPVVPASVPASGPACSCPVPAKKIEPPRAEPPKKVDKPTKPTRTATPPRGVRPPTDDDIFGPGAGPPRVSGAPPVSISIGIGRIGGSRPPSHQPPSGHRPPTHTPTPMTHQKCPTGRC